MNRLIILMVSLLAMLAVSCSSDEPKTEIDSEVVQAYRAGGVTKCFKIADLDIFIRDNSHSKWKRPDSDYVVDLIYNRSILFSNGKVCTSLNFSLGQGELIDRLSMVWEAYRKKTQCKEILYVAVPFELDESTNRMRIDDSLYNVEKMTETELRINDNVSDDDCMKIVFKYELSSISPSEVERIVTFDSRKDAYYHIVKVAREYFGDTIDLNKVYAPNIILDDPIIDLNELEDRLDAGMY